MQIRILLMFGKITFLITDTQRNHFSFNVLTKSPKNNNRNKIKLILKFLKVEWHTDIPLLLCILLWVKRQQWLQQNLDPKVSYPFLCWGVLWIIVLLEDATFFSILPEAVRFWFKICWYLILYSTCYHRPLIDHDIIDLPPYPIFRIRFFCAWISLGLD